MDYELVTWTEYALLRRGSSIRIAPESPRTVDTLCIGGFFLDLGNALTKLRISPSDMEELMLSVRLMPLFLMLTDSSTFIRAKLIHSCLV